MIAGDWSHGKILPLTGLVPMLAVCRNLSWGYPLWSLHVASPCGFLASWKHGGCVLRVSVWGTR